MSWAMAVLTTSVMALGLSACQPNDVHTQSVKERLDSGKVVEFTEPGYRRPSCSEWKPDWEELRIANEGERQRIVIRTQESALNPGRHSCFRVGSAVILDPRDGTRQEPGSVRITKLALVKLEFLHKGNLKGKVFASSTEFERYREEFKSQMWPEHEGIVTIVEFQYVTGSAIDEQQLLAGKVP